MFDRHRGICCVVGTRPEVVKMAPVFLNLTRTAGLKVSLISTGQHRGLLDETLQQFRLTPDLDLDLMSPDQEPADIAAKGLERLSAIFREAPPALVLAQGDTTSVLCAGLAAFYAKIPFGHVEAGLRTGNPARPFPEETQRVLASHLASFHFAPTSTARQNLIWEGIDPNRIRVTGNTVIDALRMFPHGETRRPALANAGARFLLVTAHRRENFGEPLEEICSAIRALVDRHPDLGIVWPVHPNPQVTEPVHRYLGSLPRVCLLPPLGYSEFLAVMSQSSGVLTDSGGVQEEAPALGKPVIVLRGETERGEILHSASVRLVGTDSRAIIRAVEELILSDLRPTPEARSPVGDGYASDRIARTVLPMFGFDARPLPTGVPEEWSAG